MNAHDNQQLREQIQRSIANNGGSITFAEFMQLALYSPGLGYYSAATKKFGAGGDFITAPEIGSLFASCLAKQITQIFQNLYSSQLKMGIKPLQELVILELGAGTGKLAAQLLTCLKPPANLKYLILEVSSDLRARQQQHILATCPEYFAQITWLDSLPSQPFAGVIIANEVIDAMPATRIKKTAAGFKELGVSYNHDFFWSEQPLSADLIALINDPAWQEYFAKLPIDYETEINLALPAWINALANTLQQGCMLLFDYGFPRREYYHPQRSAGTLMCHHRHRAHADPFINIGTQDITTHVDFSTVAYAALAANLTILGYTNLAAFLLNCGITEQTDHATVKASVALSTELNLLTSPAEMGEIFKVIACGRGISEELLGFSDFNKQDYL